MNEQIRKQVNARLEQKKLSRADLARALGVHQNVITRALNDTGGHGGNIPRLWGGILETLDLEVVARRRRSE